MGLYFPVILTLCFLFDMAKIMANFAPRASKRDAKGKGKATTSNPFPKATTGLSAQPTQVGVLLGMAQKTSIPHVAIIGGVTTASPQTKRPPHFAILAFT